MLLIVGVVIVLIAVVISPKMRVPGGVNASTLGWMSDKWLAEHRASHSREGFQTPSGRGLDRDQDVRDGASVPAAINKRLNDGATTQLDGVLQSCPSICTICDNPVFVSRWMRMALSDGS